MPSSTSIITIAKKSVISGQQVGLLGGPLFMLIKIIGVSKTAQEKNLKPIFWLETNDADFNEIKRSYYLDKKKKLTSISWDINSQGKSIGYLKIDHKLLISINRFLNNLLPTPHTTQLKKIIIASYQMGQSLANANIKFFQLILQEWEELDLNEKIFFFNPQNQDFINFSQIHLLKEASKTKVNQQVNAFLIINQKRLAVFKKKNGFFLRDGRKVDLKKNILVPNLYTRSVLQDAFLKCKYYLAGTSEYQYLKSSLMQKQYHYHQVQPAKPINRGQVEIISQSDFVFLKQCKRLRVEDFFFLPTFRIKQKILSQKGFNKKELFAKLTALKEDYLKQLKKLKLPTKKLEKILYQQHKHLLGKFRQKIKSHNSTLFQRINQLSTHCFPLNQPASRVFSVAYYYNLYGKNLVKAIFKNYKNNKNKTIVL